MKYYVIVGEASGDLHGSKLLAAIKQDDTEAQFRFWGGDKMAEVASAKNMVKHYRETSFMGFWEVIKNFRTIYSQMRLCKHDIDNYKPDVLVLIDYAGFNLRMAAHAKKRNIRTYFYIAPKVWAWKETRVKKIKKYVDELFVIFPFEIEYFKQWGIKAHYFGNPIMDAIEERNLYKSSLSDFLSDNSLDTNKPIVALLAGSRKNEILYNLPFMEEVASHFPDYQFVVAGVAWLKKDVYTSCIKNKGGNIYLLTNKTYEILSHSTAAIVTSGTATLEAALLGIPELVCYWCNPISAAVAKVFLKIKWVSLVNIIMGREVVTELIYKDMVVERAVKELRSLLPGGSHRSAMLSDFALLEASMGKPGASGRVAAKMVELLKEDMAK